MPVVAMPDGAQVQFPDDMPPAQIKALILQKFPDAGKSQPISSDQVKAALDQGLGGGNLFGIPIPNMATLPLVAANNFADAGTLGVAPAIARTVSNAVSPGSGDRTQAAMDMLSGSNPVAAAGGQIAGTIAPLAAVGGTQLGARALGMSGSVPMRMFAGAGSGAALNAADSAVHGGSAQDVINAGETGAVAGGLFAPVAKVGEGVANGVRGALGMAGQSGVENSGSQAIKSVADDLFTSAKSGNIAISPDAYAKFSSNLARKVVASGIDPALHPDTVAALKNLMGRNGRAISIAELHNIRQIAQDATLGQVARDAAKARPIVTGIDDFVKSLKPSDLVSPSGGANVPTQKANDLLNGISLWSKASKATTIENAIYRAQNAASGFENGLRNSFRSILNDPSSRRVFAPDELKQIESVVRGTPGSNLLKLLGKFGFGHGAASNMLGGTVGFGLGSVLGGPVGGMAATLAATGARRASEKMTATAAQKALDLVTQKAGIPSGPSAAQALFQQLMRPANVPVLAPAALPMLALPPPLRVNARP